MSDRSIQKAQSVFKNDIKNFIYQTLEEVLSNSYGENDYFNAGYESAMDEMLDYLDRYDEQKDKEWTLKE
jgi:hypothetical protein